MCCVKEIKVLPDTCVVHMEIMNFPKNYVWRIIIKTLPETCVLRMEIKVLSWICVVCTEIKVSHAHVCTDVIIIIKVIIISIIIINIVINIIIQSMKVLWKSSFLSEVCLSNLAKYWLKFLFTIHNQVGSVYIWIYSLYW